jgi:hypothetical protein
MTDRTTKIILAFIALGLWLNALGPFLHVKTVSADDNAALQSIADDMSKISRGLCLNSIICK